MNGPTESPTLTSVTTESTADIPRTGTDPAPSTSPGRCLTKDELQDIAQFVDSDLLALLGQC